MSFMMVRFTEEDGAPGIIASNWLSIDKKTCFYPNVRSNEAIEKLIKKRAKPEETWPQYPVKVLQEYDFYGDARLHLKKAEETSHLESEDEDKPRQRRKKRVVFSEESSENEDCENGKLRREITKIQLPAGSNKNVNIEYPAPPSDRQYENNLDGGSTGSKAPSSSVHVVGATTFPLNCPSGCVISRQFAVQQAQLIHQITELSQGFKRLETKLDSILIRSEHYKVPDGTEESEDIRGFLTALPVESDEHFIELNNELNDTRSKKILIKYLGSIGGKDPRTLATNMLRRVLQDSVAELYSLTGKQMKTSKKKSFQSTEVCKVIFYICKKVYDCTEQKLNEIVSDWLNQAKVRNSRRAERQQKKINRVHDEDGNRIDDE